MKRKMKLRKADHPMFDGKVNICSVTRKPTREEIEEFTKPNKKLPTISDEEFNRGLEEYMCHSAPGMPTREEIDAPKQMSPRERFEREVDDRMCELIKDFIPPELANDTRDIRELTDEERVENDQYVTDHVRRLGLKHRGYQPPWRFRKTILAVAGIGLVLLLILLFFGGTAQAHDCDGHHDSYHDELYGKPYHDDYENPYHDHHDPFDHLYIDPREEQNPPPYDADEDEIDHALLQLFALHWRAS